jgi:hypothetical protein
VALIQQLYQVERAAADLTCRRRGGQRDGDFSVLTHERIVALCVV